MQTRATATDTASHASKPFFGAQPAYATHFFASSPAIQTKLTVGESGDRFEREADSVADAVVQRTAKRASGGTAVPSVQAMCAKCEHDDTVHRKPDGSASDTGAHVADSVQQGLAAQRGAGQALDTSLRREMEESIGADFSGVRIHTSAPAAGLNDVLHARAFTHGQEVFFNSGQFDPGSSAGRHLLAHELTHVVQQSGGAPGIQRDEAGGGSTDFIDSVNSPVRTSRSGVISGEVTRMEMAPAGPRLPGPFQRLPDILHPGHPGRMNVSFDPSTCTVTIPFGYRFVQAEPEDRRGCDAGPPPARMSTTAFNALKARVLSAVNTGLNDWFEVTLSGSGCPGGCADRPLPIRVVATENNSSPDRTITVVNRAGRADEGTICALSWDEATAVHEGGHQVFGVGNEYVETDESFREEDPDAFRPEIVRRDYSAMGPEQRSRFAMFHERHFNAVKVFLEHIFPNCQATLVARARPVIPDFRVDFGTGFTALSGLPGFYFRLGAEVGIPLDRLRRWEVTLGPEFTTMLAFGDQRLQGAFLLGARIGLEGSTGDAGFGITGGPFISGGYGWFQSTDRASGVGSRDAGGAYGEIGGRLGLRTGLENYRWNFSLEGAGGTALGAPAISSLADPGIASDPARSHWFRVGLGAAAQF